ncbi:hypothetical protein F4781DRAFT_392969 [Annulohypoxylon bovei var. microspora]|nr:hypothetical protein F4781DRAFT_392969 [Annulohypoxylon bovei var. microspora]
MADPLTILGAAAASFQFAGYAIKGLLKATELVHDIHDVPQRMSQYLGHIDHEVALVNTLLRPDSPIFDQLSTTQYARISTPAIEARKLMEEIQQDLRPLVDVGQDPSRPHKKWKTIVRTWKSLKNEKDLEKKMNRLERLNASLLRELEVSGFETQSLLRDQGSQILTGIAASAADILDTRHLTQQTNAVQSQIIDIIKSRETSMAQSIDALRQDIVESQASTSRSMVEAKNGLNTLSQEIRGNVMLSSNKFHTQLSDHRVELSSRFQNVEHQVALIPHVIRSELQAALMDFTKQQSHTSRSTPVQTGDSTFEIDLRCGTARLENSNHAIQPSPEPVGHITPHGRSGRWRCRCKAGISTTVWSYGKLGFRSKTQPVISCPIHGKRHEWSYSIEAKLSPFLLGTLELTLGLLSGRKGWGIESPMKFKSVVKRSESPIFQLFDHFVETWATTISEEEYYARTHSISKWNVPLKKQQYFICEKQSFEKGVSSIIRGIQDSITSGQASGSDMDENGSTLLIEICVLLCSFITITENAGSKINQLIRIARDSGVDPTATIENRPNGIYSYYHSNPAIEFIYREFGGDTNQNASISFYDSLVEYDGLLESAENFKLDEGEFKLLLAYPEIAEGMGCSDLCLAIIRRSLPGLKKLYHVNQFELGYAGELSPMNLAIGWPDGLRFLVDRDHDITSSLKLACGLEDRESASILLSTNTPISYSGIIFAGKSFKPIYQMLIEELQKRREAIRLLALRYLNKEEQDKVGLSKPFASEENDHEIYCLLEPKIKIPEFIKNIMQVPVYCNHASDLDTSAYIFPFSDLDHYKITYDAGFVNVDMPCMHGMTPLAELCEYSLQMYLMNYFSSTARWHLKAAWFIERGASPQLHSGDRSNLHWPHLLFYLSAIKPVDEFDKGLADVCSYEFVRDQCECFCSRRGCIPPFMFWRCLGDSVYRVFRHECLHNYRFARLREWTAAWNLSKMQKEDCYREICQLELFERLGMAHTCCCISRRDNPEAEEIRSEDRFSALQLKQLLRLYRRMRKLLSKHPIEEFWMIWWKIVDDILPSLLTEEACGWLGPKWYDEYEERKKRKAKILIGRADRWENVLKEAGYEGRDFGDVIKCHFTKFLVLCKTIIERRDRWKRHRLIGSSKSPELRRRRYNVYR